MIRGITNRDHHIRKAKLEHMLSHWAAQDGMRIIELETVVRVTVPWVRIPPSPPAIKLVIYQVFSVYKRSELLGVFRALHTGLIRFGS